MSTEPVKIVVDVLDLTHLMAGGTLVLSAVGVELIPSQHIYTASNRIRTRVNGGRRTVSRPPESERDAK